MSPYGECKEFCQLPVPHHNSLAISFLWIPSHIGLTTNASVDRFAKTACGLTLPDVFSVTKIKYIQPLISSQCIVEMLKGHTVFPSNTMVTFFLAHTSIVVTEWWFVYIMLWVPDLGWGTGQGGRSLRQSICLTTPLEAMQLSQRQHPSPLLYWMTHCKRLTTTGTVSNLCLYIFTEQ